MSRDAGVTKRNAKMRKAGSGTLFDTASFRHSTRSDYALAPNHDESSRKLRRSTCLSSADNQEASIAANIKRQISFLAKPHSATSSWYSCASDVSNIFGSSVLTVTLMPCLTYPRTG